MVGVSVETFGELYRKHVNFEKMGSILGCSRERIRQLANQYNIQPICGGCGCDVNSFRTAYCDECRVAMKKEAYRKWVKRNRKGNNHEYRGVVAGAVDFFIGCGLEASTMDKKPGEAEVIVFGNDNSIYNIKVYSLTRTKSGFQTRLDVAQNIDMYYLSDGDEMLLLLPVEDVNETIHYIGRTSKLMQYSSVSWIDSVIKKMSNGEAICG